MKISGRLEGLFLRQEGQAMVEYALILALVSAVAFAALQTIGPAVAQIFQEVANGFA